ncbi:MAG: TraB/GumN family protein [Shimia sp.]|nr:TraB/GumN family protein [Shimia sp.]
MRILPILLFLIIFSGIASANCAGPNVFPSLAESERQALESKAAAVPFSEGLLWRAEKDGVVSHLIGTFHVHLPEHAAMVTRLGELTPQPEKVFLELTDEDQLGFQRHLTENPDSYLIQSGPSLIDRLGPKLWPRVEEQLKARGMPPFLAARYQPWFLGMTLMLPPCAYEVVKSGKKGLDQQVSAMAKSNDLPTVSLDSIDGLLTLLASDPIEEQLEDLRWGLSLNTDLAAPDLIGTVIAMYLDETTQLIWEFNSAETFKNVSEDADQARLAALLKQAEDDLIITRNAAWAEVLAMELTQTPALVAVGALHLPGKHGVLNLLQNAGFTLTRVPLKPL